MEKFTDIYSIEELKIRRLKRHFKSLGECVLIEGNTPVGVHETSAFLGIGIADQVAKKLKSSHYDLTAINMNNLFLNKVRQLESSLKGNITIRENQLAKYFGSKMAVEKLIEDSLFFFEDTFQKTNTNREEHENKIANISRVLSNVTAITKPCYQSSYTQSKKGISDLIQESKEPHFILNAGCNDLMFRIRNNPVQIERDSKNRYKNGNYSLTQKLIKEGNVIPETIEELRKTILLLKELNPRIQIHLPNGIIPENLKNNRRKLFRKLIEDYNGQLQQLCLETGCSYIDLNINQKSDNWTHLFSNKSQEQKVKNLVIDSMCRSIDSLSPTLSKVKTSFHTSGLGIREVENKERSLYIELLKQSTLLEEDRDNQYGDPKKLEAAQITEKRKVLREIRRNQQICKIVEGHK